MDYKIINDTEQSRIKAVTEGRNIGVIDYKMTNGDVMTIYHTQVAPVYQGQGIAEDLTKNLLDYAQENNIKVRPICRYAKAYLARHNEYDSIVTDKQ